MDQPGPDQAPLYAQVLGTHFQALSPTLQAYLSARPSRWKGQFLVKRGSNPLSRLMGWILALPPPGPQVSTRLHVEALPRGERWIRRFEGHEFPSDQHLGPQGDLVEAAGPMEFHLRVEPHDGGLTFTGLRLRLRLRTLRIPLPRFVMPTISGWLATPGQGTLVYSHIRIHHPWVGTLSEYSGTLTRVD